jgi:hypothetical protein
MQVAFFVPPAAAPVAVDATSAELSAATAGRPAESFASVLAANAEPPAAVSPRASSPTTPSAREAETGTSEAGDDPDFGDEVAAEADEVVTAWPPVPPVISSVAAPIIPVPPAGDTTGGAASADAAPETGAPQQEAAAGKSAAASAVERLSAVKLSLPNPDHFAPRPLFAAKEPGGTVKAEEGTVPASNGAAAGIAGTPVARSAEASAEGAGQSVHPGGVASGSAVANRTDKLVTNSANGVAALVSPAPVATGGIAIPVGGAATLVDAAAQSVPGIPPAGEVGRSEIAHGARQVAVAARFAAADGEPIPEGEAMLNREASMDAGSRPVRHGRMDAAAPSAGASTRPLPTVPGMRVAVVAQRDPAAAGAAPVVLNPTNGAEVSSSAAANPVVAAPTLAQVLFDRMAPQDRSGAAGSRTRGVAGLPEARAAGMGAPLGGETAATATGAPAVAAATDPTSAKPSASAAPLAAKAAPNSATTEAGLQRENLAGGRPALAGEALATGGEGGGKGAENQGGGDAPTLHQAPPENLAPSRGRNASAARPGQAATTRQNFLSVDPHGVGESGRRFGMTVAKEAQTMSAHVPVLPTPTASVLEVNEPSVVSLPGTATVAGRTSLEPVEVRTFAAAAVREAMDLAERAQQAGRNHLDLRLQTGDDESLRVHLRWHDGVVHAKFVTQTNEMQQALSREWDHLAPRMADKGIRFGEASFERHDQSSGQSSTQNASSFEQQRHSSRGQGQTFAHAEEQAFAGSSSFVKPAASALRGGVAPAAVSPSSATTASVDARNLRAWA